MINKHLRKDLLKKLDCGPSALSQRIKCLKKNYPMTSDDAAYVIAHKQGVILDRYLPTEKVNHVRGILQQIQPLATQEMSKTKRTTNKTPNSNRTVIISKEFRTTDPILPSEKLKEAKDMAAIYPFLYILENSIRELIYRVMTQNYGQDWWDQKAPQGLKEEVINRMADDKKDSWHQRRGARPIDYLDLKQLPSLMRKIQNDVVPDIIPSIEWFNQLVEEVYKSRCVVCHMNPLDRVNIEAVKLRFSQWQRQIRDKTLTGVDKR